MGDTSSVLRVCCCNSTVDESSSQTISQPIFDEVKEEPLIDLGWEPLQLTIVSARHLRNADWSLPFMHNVSDPFCICEITGKPLSRFVTDYLKDTLNPVWNHEGRFADFAEGDKLVFTLWDRDYYKWKNDDFLGYVEMTSDMFFPNGFDDELLLKDAGKNNKAYLKLKIEPAVRKGQKMFKRDRTESQTLTPFSHTSSQMSSFSATRSYSKSKQSGNANTTSEYMWLEESLNRISANEAGLLKCQNGDTKKKHTPILFCIGGCPNALCGMQAVMFAVDANNAVDFWWVKPSKANPQQLEKDTLNLHSSGKNKNDPGRSKAFYQPLAGLFEQRHTVKSWSFGLKDCDINGKKVVRAVLENSATGEVLHLLFLWQEDWTQNPFARSKFIKGKLVYQRSLEIPEYFYRQYEIHDGDLTIAELEDGPAETVLGMENIKNLYDLALEQKK